MKKTLLIISACLIVLGLVLAAVALAAAGFDFEKLSTDTTLHTTHTIDEAFQQIQIAVDTTDVRFFPSQDGTCKVVVSETERYKHTVTVQNDTLILGIADTRRWFEHIGISFSNLTAEIYLPNDQYTALFMESDTGDLNMPGAFTFAMANLESDTGDIHWQADVSGRLSIQTDTGDVMLLGLHAGTLELESDTGDVQLINTLAEESILVETNTGDVIFERADGGSIQVQTDTGDVTGTVLTDKTFRAQSDTGRIRIPWDTTGGSCNIFTDTGDIELSVAE